MAEQRALHVGDPVRLPSGQRTRIMVAAIPDRPWVAVQIDGQWAVRRDGDPIERPG